MENLDEGTKLDRFIRAEGIEAKIQHSKGKEEEERRGGEVRERAKLEESLAEFKPVPDPVCLRGMGQEDDAISRMKLRLVWHRKIGKDPQVPEHFSKLKLWMDVRDKSIEAVERHLNGRGTRYCNRVNHGMSLYAGGPW